MTDPHPQELLAPFVDGELSGEDRRAVEAHLAGCPTCTEEVVQSRRALTALRGLEEMPAPAGLATPAIQRARPESRWVRRLAYAGAAAAAAAIIAVFAVSRITEPSPLDEAKPGADTGGPEAAGGGGAAGYAAPLFISTTTNYSAEDLQARVRGEDLVSDRNSTTGGQPQPQASPAPGAPAGGLDSADAEAAVNCVERAGLRAEEGAELIQIEAARFEDEPAYIVFFRRDEETLELWVVDREDCQIRYVATAKA